MNDWKKMIFWVCRKRGIFANEDIVQDCYLELIKAKKYIDLNRPIYEQRAYQFKVIGKTLTRIKHFKYKPIPEISASYPHKLDNEDLAEYLLQGLTTQEKRMMNLVYKHGKLYKEVAKICKISIQRVEQILSEAKGKCRIRFYLSK